MHKGRNIAASVRARLKNRADTTDEDFNLLLTRYGLERLLYRLSISEHAPNFLLKGALLFQLWHELPHRPTRDADLLGFGASDVALLVKVFRDVCAVSCEDGLEFDADSVRGGVIRKQAGYGGVRIDLRATLNGAVLALQVDIGFGDVVTPEALMVIYPVLLDDQPAPRLRAYPKYTVCAEKLHLDRRIEPHGSMTRAIPGARPSGRLRRSRALPARVVRPWPPLASCCLCARWRYSQAKAIKNVAHRNNGWHDHGS